MKLASAMKSWAAKMSTSKRLQPVLQRVMPPLDRFFNKITRGRVHLTDVVLPTLVLHHTGRKSGLARTTPLAYISDNGTYLVIGSNWGGLDHPAWALNISDKPEVEVELKGRRFPAVAQRLEGEARADAWDKMSTMWPSFNSYEETAQDRDIRVFALVPQ